MLPPRAMIPAKREFPWPKRKPAKRISSTHSTPAARWAFQRPAPSQRVNPHRKGAGLLRTPRALTAQRAACHTRPGPRPARPHSPAAAARRRPGRTQARQPGRWQHAGGQSPGHPGLRITSLAPPPAPAGAWRRPRRPSAPGRCRPPAPCGRTGSGPCPPGSECPPPGAGPPGGPVAPRR